jgi:putative transposase
VCGAEYGQRSSERVNQRNGYRQRQFDTRAGTLDLAIPKLRQGSYFPDWLLERRKRAERALTTVVATCYLLGVSTRRMDKLVETLGITSLSKSQVSVMAKELDIAVEAFRTRPLDAGPYTFMAADALVLKVREAGRVVNVHALIAVGVNAEGYREILGVDVTTAEDGAGWLTILRSLTARGLSGVRLVTSDAHAGLLSAIGATLPGTSWQRCRTHYATNLMAITPKSSWPWVRTLARVQPDTQQQLDAVATFDLRRQPFDLLLDAQRGQTCAGCVVLQCDRRAKDCHDAITGELIDSAAVPLHHRRGSVHQLSHDLAQPLCTHRCRDVHRMDHIGEQHRHLLVLSGLVRQRYWRTTLAAKFCGRAHLGAARPTYHAGRGHGIASAHAICPSNSSVFAMSR